MFVLWPKNTLIIVKLSLEVKRGLRERERDGENEKEKERENFHYLYFFIFFIPYDAVSRLE